MGSGAARIAAEGAEALGLGAVTATPAFVARGQMGEVFRVETHDLVAAVKVLFPWAEVGAIPADIAIQETAAAAGVPLPRPLRATDGTAVIRAGGRAVRAYEWLDLAPPLRTPIRVTTVAEAGDILGRIHASAQVTSDPIEDWYTTPLTELAWHDLANEAAAAQEPWAKTLAEDIQHLVALDRFSAGEPVLTVTTHRDFDRSNVLPRADDGRLVVLDWENAGPLPLDWDLAAGLDAWTTVDGLADKERVTTFITAYEGAGGPAHVTGPASFRSVLITTSRFVGILARDVLSKPEQRGHALPLLLHFLGGAEQWRRKAESILDALN